MEKFCLFHTYIFWGFSWDFSWEEKKKNPAKLKEGLKTTSLVMNT